LIIPSWSINIDIARDEDFVAIFWNPGKLVAGGVKEGDRKLGTLVFKGKVIMSGGLRLKIRNLPLDGDTLEGRL
jgi:hypothetical protein